MWHWDQGRLAYFQFDALRRIASFVREHDFRAASREMLASAIGLPFSVPETHTPWRNYSRVLKLALLVSEVGDYAAPTAVADALATPGAVTCDEYFHFLARAFTEPAPALKAWRREAAFRHPLLISLKYLLAKVAIDMDPAAGLDELIGAYASTGMEGDEDQESFIDAVSHASSFEEVGGQVPYALRRQARESLLVLAQISYLHVRNGIVTVSLHRTDAEEVFNDLTAIGGPREANSNAEIRRLASLFRDGSTDIDFDFPHTVVSDVEESGFIEGSKVKRTHIIIERNASLRREYFRLYPSAVCDVCGMNTARTYPWTDRVLDLHHLRPLASGTRVEDEGTSFADLAPVCPSCHRGIHRFYDRWLVQRNRKDFESSDEARGVYGQLKRDFPGIVTNV